MRTGLQAAINKKEKTSCRIIYNQTLCKTLGCNILRVEYTRTLAQYKLSEYFPQDSTARQIFSDNFSLIFNINNMIGIVNREPAKN